MRRTVSLQKHPSHPRNMSQTGVEPAAFPLGDGPSAYIPYQQG